MILAYHEPTSSGTGHQDGKVGFSTASYMPQVRKQFYMNYLGQLTGVAVGVGN